MNTPLPPFERSAQEKSIAQLEAQGYRFSNWIPGEPGPDGEWIYETKVAVMIKRPNRFTRLYAEVESDGTIRQ